MAYGFLKRQFRLNNPNLGSKDGVKRAIQHKAMNPGIKKTARTPKNLQEDNQRDKSVTENKERTPTKDKQQLSYMAYLSPDMGEKDAAKGTRTEHIQMGAEAIAKPQYNPCKQAYKTTTKKHKANMAKEENHKEVDPQGSPYKARLF